jgi:hypothetical protein
LAQIKIKMSKQVFMSLTIEELEQLISKSVNQSIQGLNQIQNDPAEDLIKGPEAREILKVSRTTLHNYVQEGRINSYQLGSRVFYSRKEIIDAVKSSSNHE